MRKWITFNTIIIQCLTLATNAREGIRASLTFHLRSFITFSNSIWRVPFCVCWQYLLDCARSTAVLREGVSSISAVAGQVRVSKGSARTVLCDSWELSRVHEPRATKWALPRALQAVVTATGLHSIEKASEWALPRALQPAVTAMGLHSIEREKEETNFNWTSTKWLGNISFPHFHNHLNSRFLIPYFSV